MEALVSMLLVLVMISFSILSIEKTLKLGIVNDVGKPSSDSALHLYNIFHQDFYSAQTITGSGTALNIINGNIEISYQLSPTGLIRKSGNRADTFSCKLGNIAINETAGQIVQIKLYPVINQLTYSFDFHKEPSLDLYYKNNQIHDRSDRSPDSY